MRRTDLPHMASCDGCASRETRQACCTIVRVRPEEAKRIRHYIRDNGVEWQQAAGIQCGFAREGNVCAIYDVRPWVCRAYGVVKQLPCPHYPEEAVIDFPPEQATALRLSDPDDNFLGMYFEPGYMERMTAALQPAGAK